MVLVEILNAFTLFVGIVVVALFEKIKFAAKVVSPVTFIVDENVPVVPEIPPDAVRVDAVMPPAVMVSPPVDMVAPLVMTILSKVSTFWV